MKHTTRLAYAMAICCTTFITSCESTNKDTAEEELQQETKASLGSQLVLGSEEDTMAGTPANDTATNPALGASAQEMLPSKSILENVAANPKLSVLASILRKTDLMKDLTGTGPYTIFAPTNDAFNALPAGTIADLMKPENKARLVAILKNHVVAGKTSAADLQDGNTLRTMADAHLQVQKKLDEVMISGAEIEKPDNMSTNGVIHVINKVLLPAV